MGYFSVAGAVAAMMASSDAGSPPPAPALSHESISAASDMESLTHVQSPASRLHQMHATWVVTSYLVTAQDGEVRFGCGELTR
jgi:hypothetical protein